MIPVGSRVRLTDPVDYGAGTQHWVGRIGTVKTSRERSCDVLVDGEQHAVWFFNRELSPVDTNESS